MQLTFITFSFFMLVNFSRKQHSLYSALLYIGFQAFSGIAKNHIPNENGFTIFNENDQHNAFKTQQQPSKPNGNGFVIYNENSKCDAFKIQQPEKPKETGFTIFNDNDHPSAFNNQQRNSKKVESFQIYRDTSVSSDGRNR